MATEAVADWRALRITDLQFWHRGEARIIFMWLLAITLILVIVRSLLQRRPGRHRIVVPAILKAMPKSYTSFVLYVPLVPVSVKKGMLVSLLQLLLRIFLDVLIVAVVMVILAVAQILRGGGEAPKAALPSPFVR